jgi:hypothetical protein
MAFMSSTTFVRLFKTKVEFGPRLNISKATLLQRI